MKVILKSSEKDKTGDLLYPIEEGKVVWVMDGANSIKTEEVVEITKYNRLGFGIEFRTLTDNYRIEYL